MSIVETAELAANGKRDAGAMASRATKSVAARNGLSARVDMHDVRGEPEPPLVYSRQRK